MQVTAQLKQSVTKAIKEDMARKSQHMTDTRHANILGISPSVYSRLKKGETEKILSEGEWVRIGKELLVDLDGLGWVWANTETFQHITAQLMACKQMAISAIFCDKKGIGKTSAGRWFAAQYPNAAYVDCSQCKTKRELIRAIARAFGFDYEGKLADVKANMISNIMTLHEPLLELDEVGDLNYDAWLELKSIWNALEGLCGFYMMGANGLQKKIEKQIRNRTVGFEEIFDRYGDRFQQITRTMTETEVSIFDRRQAELILRANLPKINAEKASELIKTSANNLRRIRLEVVKHKKLVG